MSDPIEVVMEEALRPGRYISEHASFSLVKRALIWLPRISGPILSANLAMAAALSHLFSLLENNQAGRS